MIAQEYLILIHQDTDWRESGREIYTIVYYNIFPYNFKNNTASYSKCFA